MPTLFSKISFNVWRLVQKINIDVNIFLNDKIFFSLSRQELSFRLGEMPIFEVVGLTDSFQPAQAAYEILQKENSN